MSVALPKCSWALKCPAEQRCDLCFGSWRLAEWRPPPKALRSPPPPVWAQVASLHGRPRPHAGPAMLGGPRPPAKQGGPGGVAAAALSPARGVSAERRGGVPTEGRARVTTSRRQVWRGRQQAPVQPAGLALHSWENLLRTRPRHPPSALPGPRWDPHRPVPATRCSRWPAVSSCCCRGCQPRRGTPPAQAAGRTGPGRDAPCLWSNDSEGQGERVGTVSREQYPDSLDTRRVGLSPPEAKGEASTSGPGGAPCRAGGAVSAGAPTASDRGVPRMSPREAWLWRQTDRPAPTPAWASASCP